MKNVLTALLFLGVTMSQAKYPGYEFVKEEGGIKEYRLISNDLSVLLKQDNTAPVATFMVTYNVGSRNEAIGYTGSTHLLEHLMFKGSKKFNTDKGNSVFQVLQSVGARMNATTWLDRTNYFATVPSQYLETVIEVEADRMRNAYIKEEDRQSEMTVVRNEYERGQNSPVSVLDENIWATAYHAHPYHHSTIGWKTDIENVSIERLKKFYDTFYWPNNSTAIAIGDFSEKEALALIKKHFGRIKKSKEDIPQVYTEEPVQEGKRTITLKRAGQQAVLGVAHKTPAATHKDAPAFVVLSSVLSSGKNSRFYKNITDKGLTTSIYIWDSLFKDPGLFTVFANLSPEVSHQEVENLIISEYEKIANDGLTDEELDKAKAQILSSLKFGQDGSYSIAGGLNEAIASGDWTLYTSYEEKINAVSVEDVQKIVNDYFKEDFSTIGYFIPESGGSQGSAKSIKSAQELKEEKIKYFSKDEDLFSAKVQYSQPVEGVSLYTLNRGSGVVTLRGSFLGGDIYAPESNPRIPDMVVSMLDQGTSNQTKFEISEKLEKVGARLGFSNGKDSVGFSAKFLSSETELILDLLSDQLANPKFDNQELGKIKKQLETGYKRSKESTRGNAVNNMLEAFYGKNHQNSPIDPDEAIADINKATREELLKYHKEFYGRGSMIIVAVGDVSHDDLSNMIKEKLSILPLVNTKPLKEKALGQPVSSKTYVSMQDKTSTDFIVGTPLGIDRYSDDYIPMFLANHVLGGNFSARLMQTVRVKEGLTYGINSSVSGMGNGNDGYWYVGGTFAPQLLERGETATLEQIKKWASEGITQDELDIAKSTINGNYQVAFDTTGGIASSILSSIIDYGSLDYIDNYTMRINAVTLDEVNKAIKRYIKFDDLYQVAAGSIDENGKPLND
jgi:zinc protease